MGGKKINRIVILFTLVVAILFGVIFGVVLDAKEVSGATNQTLVARVNVSNTEPNLYNVSISPLAIDLNPGNTTWINCTGLIQDYNGWDDIAAVNATIYHADYGDGTTFDNNYRYQNLSCDSSCEMYGGSVTNASCSCYFQVEYFAYNGTWGCNMTVADAYGLSDNLDSATATVNPVIGIGIPSEIDYGDMSVTEISPMITANVSNFGNLPINISVRGYGGTDEFLPGAGNYTMLCDINNISIGYHRYSTNFTEIYSKMVNLTNTSTGIPGFDLPIRTDDAQYGNDTNSTYWRLEIPTDVSGVCNGTVQFYASDAS